LFFEIVDSLRQRKVRLRPAEESHRRSSHPLCDKETIMKTRVMTHALIATATLGLLLAATDASAFTAGRTVRANGEGGYTAGKFRAGQGPNGGGFVHGHRITTDGQGDVTSARGTAFRGPNGGSGTRYGRNTVNADGSASHESGFQGSNARGSIQSSGAATRSSDGTWEQGRTTSATRAATGNSVNVNESYSKETGLTRNVTCSDAAGNTIPCPSR
jgi:hypothetical protein